MQKGNIQLPIIIGLILASFMAIGGALVIYQANQSRSAIPELWEVPDFEFTERNGQLFGSSDMIGKINIVDFIFTNCPDICPVMSARMSELYQLYAEYDFVRFVSISVDPARDTLETLQAYADSWGVDDNRWVFLRAPLDDVVSLSEDGFKLPAQDLPMGHSNRFVLVDQNGVIRSYHDSFDDAELDALKSNIRELAKEL
ncbi:MAG: SCO family protein [candidate division Zixibacteria bacterium]